MSRSTGNKKRAYCPYTPSNPDEEILLSLIQMKHPGRAITANMVLDITYMIQANQGRCLRVEQLRSNTDFSCSFFVFVRVA